MLAAEHDAAAGLPSLYRRSVALPARRAGALRYPVIPAAAVAVTDQGDVLARIAEAAAVHEQERPGRLDPPPERRPEQDRRGILVDPRLSVSDDDIKPEARKPHRKVIHSRQVPPDCRVGVDYCQASRIH
jgi:hypothetical protein